MDPDDGLRLCPVCEDRYTTTAICSECRYQEMIDSDTPLSGYPYRENDDRRIDERED